MLLGIVAIKLNGFDTNTNSDLLSVHDVDRDLHSEMVIGHQIFGIMYDVT